VQQLLWVEDVYVLKYEVVMERDEGNGYRAFTREFTESSGLLISLVPGKYRYRVIPYDYLGQPGDASEWVILDIIQAPIIPVEVLATGDDDYLLLPSDGSQFIPGVNEIIIKKPDELKNNEGVITVEKQAPVKDEKRANIFLCAAWAPLIPLYGRMQQTFGNGFYASGAAFHFGVIFNELKWFNPGLELSSSLYALNNVQDGYNIKIRAGVIGLNFLAQKWLPNREMAITLRAGAGLGFQTGELSSDQEMYPVGGLVPQINLEPSFLWLAMKQLYLEAGIGYSLFLTENNSSGGLRTWVGVGWNF
jgi:hypothetical protein